MKKWLIGILVILIVSPAFGWDLQVDFDYPDFNDSNLALQEVTVNRESEEVCTKPASEVSINADTEVKTVTCEDVDVVTGTYPYNLSVLRVDGGRVTGPNYEFTLDLTQEQETMTIPREIRLIGDDGTVIIYQRVQ